MSDIIPTVVRAAGVLLFLGGLVSYGYLLFRAYFVRDQNAKANFDSNPSRSLGLRFSGLAAFVMVTTFEVVSGDPITFEVPGFKFQGASGPIVLWMACYLVFVASLRIAPSKQ